MSCQIPLPAPSAPSIASLLAERRFVHNYLINMILSAFRATIFGFFPALREEAGYHAASSKVRMTAGPSILRGLVWIQRSCIDPSAMRSSCSGLTPTSRSRVGRPRAGDQPGDHVRRRLVGPAERLADPRLLVGVDRVIEAQHVRQHHAGGVAVRDIGGAAQHMPDPVARALADAGLRADHRHPGADLAVEPGFEVRRVGLDRRQPASEQPQRMKGRAFGDRLAVDRADVLDGVVDGADAGRQKQPFRACAR